MLLSSEIEPMCLFEFVTACKLRRAYIFTPLRKDNAMIGITGIGSGYLSNTTDTKGADGLLQPT